MTRKIWVCYALAVLLAAAVVPASADEQSIVLLMEGKQEKLDRPLLLRGQMLVWIRDLERLGWGAARAGENGQVVLERDDLSIAFTPGQKVALINKLPIEMPVAPLAIAGRTMVPISFVARALGFGCAISTAVVVDVRKLTEQPDEGKGIVFGCVTHAGKPAAGVKLRIVDSARKFVPGVSAVTDAVGGYQFSDIPPGSYRVYAYIGDNPDYFNRWTEPVKLTKEGKAEAAVLVLGRVLSPVSPRVGESVSPHQERMSFSWSACPGAASYEVAIIEPANGQSIMSLVTKGPAALMSVKLRPGKTYHWRVRALDAKGGYLGGSPGKGGNPWSFKLADGTGG